MKKLLFATSILILLCATDSTASNTSDCKKSKMVRVTGASVLASELEYRKTRQSLLEGLLIEAATIVNGAEITTRLTTQTNVTNDQIEETLSEYGAIKARGVVLSYSFPMDAEHVSDSSLGTMLNLTVDVLVCDQSDVVPPTYVAIESIDFRNFEKYGGENLIDVVAGAIPANSNLRYVRDTETTPYRDFVVSGQVLSIAVTVEENRVSKAFNQVVTANGKQIIDHRLYRMSAIIALKAFNVPQDSYAIVHETIEKKLPWQNYDGALAQRIDEFIASSVHDASEKLYEKIIKNEGFVRVRAP